MILLFYVYECPNLFVPYVSELNGEVAARLLQTVVVVEQAVGEVVGF